MSILSIKLQYLTEGLFDESFDFNKDMQTFEANATKVQKTLIKRVKYQAGSDKAKFKELMLKEKAFKTARRSYHWNLSSVASSNLELDQVLNKNIEADIQSFKENFSTEYNKIVGKISDPDEISEHLIQNAKFNAERKKFLTNQPLIRDYHEKVEPQSAQEFTQLFLESKTLILTSDQLEAIAYLTGKGSDQLVHSRQYGANYIPDYAHENFLSQTKALKFEKTNQAELALQLVLRVISPTSILQGQESLCGPTTLMQIIARNNPIGYVKYVTNLATTGTATLSGDPDRHKEDRMMQVDVTPSAYQQLRTKQPTIPDADYIATASLRATQNIAEKSTNIVNSILFGVTYTYEIIEWFKASGFQDVHSISLDGDMPQLRERVKELSRLISRGYDVCFATISSLAEKILGGYDLALKSPHSKLKPHKIYLELISDKIAYSIMEDEGLVTGEINFYHLNSKLKNKIVAPLTKEQLSEELLKEILAITTERKQIAPEEKLPPNFFKYLVDGHYVHLRGISLDKDNPDYVHIRIATWGTEISRRIKLIELKDFFYGNSAQVGITYSRIKNYGRSQNTNTDKIGKGHPYTYLKYLKTFLIGNDWGTNTDLVEVIWSDNGQLKKKNISPNFLPFVEILNKLSPSLSYTEYLKMAIEVQDYAKELVHERSFNRDFINNSNFKIISICLNHLKKNPSALEQMANLLTGIIISDESAYNELIQANDPTAVQLKFAINKKLEQDYNEYFKNPLETYRAHLIHSIQSLRKWQVMNAFENQQIEALCKDFAAGKICNLLDTETYLFEDLYDSSATKFNKIINKLNAVNRALAVPPAVDQESIPNYQKIIWAKKSLFEYREEQEQCDFDLIQETRDSASWRVVRGILTFFACLTILPIGFLIAKAMVNQEKTGEFTLYSSTGQHTLQFFPHYKNVLTTRISNDFIDAESFRIELAYYPPLEEEMESNVIYLYCNEIKQLDENNILTTTKAIFYKSKDSEEQILTQRMCGEHYEPILKVFTEKDELNHEQLSRIQQALSQFGYFFNELESGQAALK